MNKKHTMGASLIIAGTSIGAGMLALPISTGLGGFFPAIIFYILCYIIMTATGLLYVELCLSIKKNNINIISMVNIFLGDKWKVFAWIIYLFLFYCLSVAYMSSGGNFLYSMSGIFTEKTSVFLFTLIFGFFVYKGTFIVDKINFFLMIGLILSYLIFVYCGIFNVKFSYLTNVNWGQSVIAMPIILISFGYQATVPSIVNYLKRDAKRCRIAIISGTTITLIIYLIWEFLILGILPLDGKHGIIQTNELGQSVITSLKYYINVESLYTMAKFFAFFAISTSFLGINLGLFDFLADGLKLKKKGNKKAIIAALTFLPPLIITLIYPHLFLIALDYAGGIGGIFILVFLPTLMVYKERYRKKTNVKPQVIGGKIFLYLIFFFVFIVLSIKVFKIFW